MSNAHQPGAETMKTTKRAKKTYETPDMIAAVRRMLVGGKKAEGKGGLAGRVSEDIDGLAELVALADVVEQATRTAVSALREDGFSWAEIADRLGCTRQAAQQRYGTKKASRKARR